MIAVVTILKLKMMASKVWNLKFKSTSIMMKSAYKIVLSKVKYTVMVVVYAIRIIVRPLWISSYITLSRKYTSSVTGVGSHVDTYDVVEAAEGILGG